MRQMIQLLAAAIVAGALLMYGAVQLDSRHGGGGGGTLTIYNWGDYIDPDLITQFEEKTGIKVIYQTFDSNEAMMTKIAQGGATFDIAVPSDYAISRMKEEGLLLPVDHEKLPNLEHIDPIFMDHLFDPGNAYSIPYFWGTVGIIYHPDRVEKAPESWNDLWDESLKNSILLLDSAREVIGMGLNSLGYSLNETDEARLQEAKRKLELLTPNVKAIVGDEIKLLMAGEEAAVGLVWSGDAAEIIWENEALEYVIPEEGSNIWFDNMVIPRTARNVEGAHQFINFMLDPEVAAQNAEYIGYSTPNMTALELLPEDISGDERFYPDPEVTEHLEVYENLGKHMLAHYNELFLEFKMHKK